MAKVITPNKQYNGLSATVMFVNGVGETDNPNLLAWFEFKGYEIEQDSSAARTASKPKAAKAESPSPKE
ncbi:hypothetical protein D3C76_128270 [compost metagenome]